MKIKIKKGLWKGLSESKLSFVLIALLFSLGLWMLPLMQDTGYSQVLNDSFLVNTTVNITNAAPMVRNVVLETPINLQADNNVSVQCNASVFDFDNDSLTVNATLYIENITFPSDPDDGNNHYRDSNCTLINQTGPDYNYSCSFTVNYYANNNSAWRCNVTAYDVENASTGNVSNLATVNPLVAIRMEALLDYGDLAVFDVSNDTIANVTNVGNRDTNISVDGYGASDGDGLAFVCDFGSILLNLERYSNAVGTSFPTMVPLTDNATLIEDFFVPQRTNESAESFNETFWKVQIPVGAAGVCNGKILFSASDRGN